MQGWWLLFSRLVMSSSLQLHGLQHVSLLYLPLSLGACSNSCPLSWWCHPTLSSAVVPSPLPSIPPSIRVFSNEPVLHIRGPKYWSFSFSPSNEYSGLISFRIDWFDLYAVQGTLRVFSNITVQKHQFFSIQFSLWSNSHIHIRLLEKP